MQTNAYLTGLKTNRALKNMSKARSSMIKNDALGILSVLDVRITTTGLKILVNFIFDIYHQSTKSGKILLTYRKAYFVRHSSEHDTSEWD